MPHAPGFPHSVKSGFARFYQLQKETLITQWLMAGAWLRFMDWDLACAEDGKLNQKLGQTVMITSYRARVIPILTLPWICFIF